MDNKLAEFKLHYTMIMPEYRFEQTQSDYIIFAKIAIRELINQPPFCTLDPCIDLWDITISGRCITIDRLIDNVEIEKINKFCNDCMNNSEISESLKFIRKVEGVKDNG